MRVAMLCIWAMMFIVAADCVARYLFNSPLQWATEFVTYYLMIMAVYFALADTQRNRDHVSIDLITTRFSRKTQAYIEVIISLFAIPVFAIIGYSITLNVISSFNANLFYFGYISWPVWLSYSPIAIGCVLLVLRLVYDSYSLIRFGEHSNVNLSGDDEVEA